MIFRQKKEGDKYTYTNEDLYGTIELVSHKELSPTILDQCVVKLVNSSESKGSLRDEKNDNDIEFNFIRKSQWENDEQD